MTPPTLAEQQAALVRALTARAPAPPGFDAARLDAAAHALLRKRAGEAARHWPALFAAPDAVEAFVGWAGDRPRPAAHAGWADGLEFARHRQATGGLDARAEAELRARTGGTVLSRWGRILARRH